MAELGVGTRVWIGYHPEIVDMTAICRKGVITDGPFPGGTHVQDPRDGGERIIPNKFWAVHIDGHSHPSGVMERDIYPIDDGDPVTTEETDLAEA